MEIYMLNLHRIHILYVYWWWWRQLCVSFPAVYEDGRNIPGRISFCNVCFSISPSFLFYTYFYSRPLMVDMLSDGNEYECVGWSFCLCWFKCPFAVCIGECRCLPTNLLSKPSHVVKCEFLITWSKVNLIAENSAPWWWLARSVIFPLSRSHP